MAGRECPATSRNYSPMHHAAFLRASTLISENQLLSLSFASGEVRFPDFCIVVELQFRKRQIAKYILPVLRDRITDAFKGAGFHSGRAREPGSAPVPGWQARAAPRRKMKAMAADVRANFADRPGRRVRSISDRPARLEPGNSFPGRPREDPAPEDFRPPVGSEGESGGRSSSTFLCQPAYRSESCRQSRPRAVTDPASR